MRSAAPLPGCRLAKRLRDDDRGSALVEATIVLPLIVVLCFGAVQYSLALVATSSMYDAARDAARRMSVGTWTAAQAKAAIPDHLVDWADNWSVSATSDAAEVRVTISVPGREVGILGIVPMPARFEAEVVMPVEISGG